MTIEPLTEQHLDICVQIYIDAFNNEPWNEQWTIDKARRRLTKLMAQLEFFGFVAYVGDEAVGFAAGQINEGSDHRSYFLKEFCIIPGRQGGGLGSRLLEHLEKALLAQGITYIHLATKRGGLSETFYRKNHYREVQDIVRLDKTLTVTI